ncbi:MAG: membrane protein [Nitrospinaceae bacterium]|nr:MAG: membrane protein [Nitrospinaceae bacterium]
MLKFISKNIITGLVTLLPVVFTLYLLYWLAVTAETALGGVMRSLLSDSFYWPGMGVAAGLASVFVVGMLMHTYVVQRLFSIGEQFLYRMPFARSIYRASRDFFNYFSPERKKEFEQVVSVTFGSPGMQVIGFVTQAIPENLPEGFREEDSVLVYLPLSYMIGGYAVLVPRSAIRPLDMKMEEAMRFTLTAGVTGPAKSPPGTKDKE